VSSRAYAHVSLYDVSLKSDRQLYGWALGADLVFRDATGTALATARVDKPLGTVSMIHPTVGDCRREERQGGDAWSACFDTQARWLMTWVPHVRSARVRVGSCTIEKVPVMPEESRDDWWLWWVPLPHIDNSTLTHFELTLWIDSAKCRAAESVD
jgi:hypothetical protein